MTWINPPKTHGHDDPQGDPPSHRGDLGVVWESPDGDVWESRPATVGGRGVEWVRCHYTRGIMLKRKYADA